MPSMMDHVADVSRGAVELVRLAKQYVFPDFVKQAKPEQNFGPRDGMKSNFYADPVRQQFPCDTKASTWLSALYFTEKRAEFHPKDQAQIQRRLDHYTAYWGIKSAVDAIRATWMELHKTAEEQLPDSAFAYVWVGDNGVKDRRLRLTNSMECKAAADWLAEYADRIPFGTRHTMARKILDKSASFGAKLGEHTEFLEKQAGRGVCDPEEVVAMIEARALLAPAGPQDGYKEAGEEAAPSLREQFRKMAATVRTLPRKALLPDMLVKLAETIDMLDRQMGLVGKYGPGLPRPEDVIFKATFNKVASELTQMVGLTDGSVYEKAAFSKLALSDLAAAFGDDFAERVASPLGEVDPEKMAEEAATLPRDDASLLQGLLSDNGILPTMRKAASAKQGMTPEELRGWAAAYASVA